MPAFPKSLSRPGVLRRLAVLSVLLALAATVALSDTLHAFVVGLIVDVEPIIVRHPLWGAVAFSLLAAGSAMLAFFSSAVLVPVAVQVWGDAITLLLLWVGWLLGGIGGYAVGRWLGRPMARALAGADRISRYETLFSERAPFPVILLLQLSLPSEVPGYLLGILRYRFALFVLALAVAELPYAVGTVYLGTCFLRRQVVWFLALGLLGIGFAAWSYHYLQNVLRRRDGGDAAG